MQVIRILLTLALAMCMAVASAQTQYAKGKAALTYSSWKLSAEDKAKTLKTAQLKAIEAYYAEAGEAESANFEGIPAQVPADPEAFLTDTTVLSEEDKSDAKQYNVAVRVTLNVAKLNNTIKAGSAVANASKGDKSKLTFLFVSRQIDEKKSFDTRVVQREDVTQRVEASASQKRSGREGERVSGSEVGTHASRSGSRSSSVTASTIVETGGSQTRKASQSSYALIPSENLLTVFKKVFGQAGYKVVEAAYVEPASGGKLSIAAVENDYKGGKDLKPATKRDMVMGVRNAKVPYLAYGTLDASLPETDPQTGLLRVAITVNAKIVDVSDDMPEDVANVGPVVIYGVAAEEEEARTEALTQAATRAAKDLVSQITNNGVK